MNTLKSIKTLGAALLVATLPGAALANQVPGVLLTGTVTAIQGNNYVSIDAHTYHIQNGSLAATDIQAVSTGQKVDVRLSGPANSASSEVTNIAPHRDR